MNIELHGESPETAVQPCNNPAEAFVDDYALCRGCTEAYLILKVVGARTVIVQHRAPLSCAMTFILAVAVFAAAAITAALVRGR